MCGVIISGCQWNLGFVLNWCSGFIALSFRQRSSGVFPVLLMPLTTGGVTADSLRVSDLSESGCFAVAVAMCCLPFLMRWWLGLMSRTELMDAVAVGQFTPGRSYRPRYFVVGFFKAWGALLATIGISSLLSLFCFSILWFPEWGNGNRYRPFSMESTWAPWLLFWRFASKWALRRLPLANYFIFC